MSASAEQLVFDLPLRPAFGAADFIVAGSNAAAVRLIDLWPAWPAPTLVLMGPEGSGKTHLATVWQSASGAGRIGATELKHYEPLAHAGRPLIIEDGDRGIGDEKVFFHVLNVARETKGHVLVTGRTPPADWPIALPDLNSRLRAAPLVKLGPVDDELLRAVLVKLFSDRQLPATPAAINHLARHMERSMTAALAVVATVDRLLWQRQGGVTRGLARDALAELGCDPVDGEAGDLDDELSSD